MSEEKTVNKRASTFGGGGPHRGGRSLYQVKRCDAGDGLRHGSGQVGGPLAVEGVNGPRVTRSDM